MHKSLTCSFYFSEELSEQPSPCGFSFSLLPDYTQLYSQTCMLWAAKMLCEELRPRESDGCKILLSLLSCRDRGQAGYVWAASWAASFLKTPQSFWLHDHTAALKSSQFMGIFMQLAPVQGFFSFTFISHLTWPLQYFFLKMSGSLSHKHNASK